MEVQLCLNRDVNATEMAVMIGGTTFFEIF